MCWHKWEWGEEYPENWTRWETPWSTPMRYIRVYQSAVCKKCGRIKKRRLS